MRKGECRERRKRENSYREETGRGGRETKTGTQR
jgi:hypothetical protein